MKIKRTLLVNSSDSFRVYLNGFLAKESDIEIIGEAEDGQKAIQIVRELRPDLVIMDVWMPGMSGLVAARQIKKEMPELKVIILTNFDIPQYREEAKASGASAYVRKIFMFKDLIPTIREVFNSK